MLCGYVRTKGLNKRHPPKVQKFCLLHSILWELVELAWELEVSSGRNYRG